MAIAVVRSVSVEVLGEEQGCSVKCLGRLVEHADEGLEHMRHLGRDVENHVDARLACALGQPYGVVEDAASTRTTLLRSGVSIGVPEPASRTVQSRRQRAPSASPISWANLASGCISSRATAIL